MKTTTTNYLAGESGWPEGEWEQNMEELHVAF